MTISTSLLTAPDTAHRAAPGVSGKTPRRLVGALGVAILVAGGLFARQRYLAAGALENVASGNGRIEAVEIDIAPRQALRVKDILVHEGDFVEAGQVLAQMETSTLEAQRHQAEAQLARARVGVELARSLVNERLAERTQAAALLAQRDAQLDASARRLARTQQLVGKDSLSEQVLDDDRATTAGARAGKAGAGAQIAAADAAIAAAKIQVVDAEAAVAAAQASVEAIASDIADATLKAPRAGRVQLRIAEPGEVLAPGARVLTLVDTTDVYMTFFLPTEQAGKVALGSEVRLVLDVDRRWIVPAKVSFVADVAQFTPKTVETEKERQKLMFRVKARIDPELLRRHLTQVKVGLPGEAYVRLDPGAPWPASLAKPAVE